MTTSLLFEKIAWCKGALATTMTTPQNRVADSTGNPDLDLIPHAVKGYDNFHDDAVVGCCTLGVVSMALGAYNIKLEGAEVLLKYDGELEKPLHLRFYKLVREYGLAHAQNVFREWVGVKLDNEPQDRRIGQWEGVHNIEGWNDRDDTQFTDIQEFLTYLDLDPQFAMIKECLDNPMGESGVMLWDSYQIYFPYPITLDVDGYPVVGDGFDGVAELDNPPRQGNVKIGESFDYRRSIGMKVLSGLLGGAVED